jgi:hypothetical protein
MPSAILSTILSPTSKKIIRISLPSEAQEEGGANKEFIYYLALIIEKEMGDVHEINR